MKKRKTLARYETSQWHFPYPNLFSNSCWHISRSANFIQSHSYFVRWLLLFLPVSRKKNSDTESWINMTIYPQLVNEQKWKSYKWETKVGLALWSSWLAVTCDAYITSLSDTKSPCSSIANTVPDNASGKAVRQWFKYPGTSHSFGRPG